MFYFKSIVFGSIILNFLQFTQSLVEMTPIVESGFMKSEGIIRDTFNKLFHHLKLKKIKEYSKMKEYSTIHKYFTSLALQDYETLNQIARLVRVDYKNTNKTADFMGIINNFLGLQQYAHKKRNEDNDESVIITHILYFLRILKKLKEAYDVDKVYLNVNTNILKILKGNGSLSNISLNIHKPDGYHILSENEFWEPSGRRIFKGERTRIKHFPFMASIQIFNNFHCAGSIVKSDLVITASSCLQLAWNNRLFRENPAFLTARIGSSFYNAGGEVIPILEIYFHPDYDPKNLKNNICLLRLVRHLNFRKKSRSVKKIDFDRQPTNLPITTPGISILGWGAKEHSPVIGNTWKNMLSFTVLDVYPLDECQDVYSRQYVSKKNFCAGFFSRGGGACNRDVGGPGIVDGKLMGVISFGSPVCGTPDAPTVFTKLGYYTDWIEEIMEMDVPVSKKRTTLKPLFNPFTAPPSYTSSKPTTFKIPPLTGEKMTPIPISLIDNQLRIFDENVFKDFLATMFHNKKIVENEVNVKDDKDSAELKTIENYRTKYHEEITEKSITEVSNLEPHTKIIDVSGEQSDVMYKDTGITLMDEEKQPSGDFDKELEKLIENVNLEKIVKEEVMVTPMIVKEMNEDTNTNIGNFDNSKNESVLTLLYLSDEEKRGNVQFISDDRKEVNEGLSIPVDNFEDLTRAKEKIISVLPDSELYELLEEVVG